MKSLRKGVFSGAAGRITMPEWNSLIKDAVMRDFRKRKSRGLI